MNNDRRSVGNSTPISEEVLQSVTVTHPNHPLFGQKVKIVTIRGGMYDDIVVELPDGTNGALPQSWTDYPKKNDKNPPIEASYLLDIDGLQEAANLIKRVAQKK